MVCGNLGVLARIIGTGQFLSASLSPDPQTGWGRPPRGVPKWDKAGPRGVAPPEVEETAVRPEKDRTMGVLLQFEPI